jgi:hypothetical protein
MSAGRCASLASGDGAPMSKPIRERFPALTLAELKTLAQEHRDNETVIRLLWEIRALHVVAYNAWRVEAEHYFVYPDNPQGAALYALRRALQEERWLSEMVDKLNGKGTYDQHW